MKQSILLLLLCSLLFLPACKDNRPQSESAEQQIQAKQAAYRRSIENFFGDFSSRYRQVYVMLQQEYDFSNFYYFSDDLQALQKNLQEALAMPGEHMLDSKARDYLNTINALLPLDKKVSDYSNRQGWLADGGAAAGLLFRQLLPLLEEAARMQRAFVMALQQAEGRHLQRTLHQYAEGSPQRYQLTTLYYARRIYQGFINEFAEYDDARQKDGQHPAINKQLQQDILEFEKNAQSYIGNMPETGQCAGLMNDLVDFISESRSMLDGFGKAVYVVDKPRDAEVDIAWIRRNNDLLILRRNYFRIMEKHKKGGC